MAKCAFLGFFAVSQCFRLFASWLTCGLAFRYFSHCFLQFTIFVDRCQLLNAVRMTNKKALNVHLTKALYTYTCSKVTYWLKAIKLNVLKTLSISWWSRRAETAANQFASLNRIVAFLLSQAPSVVFKGSFFNLRTSFNHHWRSIWHSTLTLLVAKRKKLVSKVHLALAAVCTALFALASTHVSPFLLRHAATLTPTHLHWGRHCVLVVGREEAVERDFWQQHRRIPCNRSPVCSKTWRYVFSNSFKQYVVYLFSSLCLWLLSD